MDISGTKISLSAQRAFKVQAHTQGPDGALTDVATQSAPQNTQDTVSISSTGHAALAASTGAALHNQGANAANGTIKADSTDKDEALSPLEKQIKNLKEKIKVLKEQLNELKGDNSEEAVKQRKQIQLQILTLNGMIITLSKKLDDKSVASPPKG